MWHLEDTGTVKSEMPSGTAQQLKSALTPPALHPCGEKQGNPILAVQILLCTLLLAAVVVGQQRQAVWYEPCRSMVRQMLTQGMDLTRQEELVRFVNGAVQQVQQQTARWMDPTAPEPLTGQGGLYPQKKKQLPPGCSLESCVPQEPLSLPLQQFAVTSGYGWRTHPISGKTDFHTGIDLAAGEGSAITAAMDGFVLSTGSSASYGNNVLLMHRDGVLTRYCHMQYVFVRRGESVQRGGLLGTVGHTGMATGAHLHFEIVHNNVRYDPAEALGL